MIVCCVYHYRSLIVLSVSNTQLIVETFILRDMENARRYLDIYRDNFSGGRIIFTKPWNVFFEGLVAFHYKSKTSDKFWEDQGRKAVSKLEEWCHLSKWNLENKL